MEFLNDLEIKELLDFTVTEKWWINRLREAYKCKPFRLKVDPSKTIRSIVSYLIESAFTRQRKYPDLMIVRTVMQHLVEAKIEAFTPDIKIVRRGVASSGINGDMIIGETPVYVTAAPTEELIRKCREDLAHNRRPLVITTEKGMGWANTLAKDANIENRLDVLEFEQFLTANIYKGGSFQQAKVIATLRQLVETYNGIIDRYETDRSLKIAMA